MKLPNFELAFIDRNKLCNYSLNAQHNRGKHEARLFAAILDLDTAASVVAAPIAAMTDFTNNVMEIGDKLNIELPLPSGK